MLCVVSFIQFTYHVVNIKLRFDLPSKFTNQSFTYHVVNIKQACI